MSQPYTNGPQTKLFNPSNYPVIGFFFGLIPVFLMSYLNSAVLPNGALIRKRIRVYLGAYLILLIAHLGFLLIEIQRLVSGKIVTDKVELIRTYIAYSPYISFAINIILLILTVRFLSINELPFYKELKTKNQIVNRSVFLPCCIGLIFVVAIYFGTSVLADKMILQPQNKIKQETIAKMSEILEVKMEKSDCEKFATPQLIMEACSIQEPIEFDDKKMPWCKWGTVLSVSSTGYKYLNDVVTIYPPRTSKTFDKARNNVPIMFGKNAITQDEYNIGNRAFSIRAEGRRTSLVIETGLNNQYVQIASSRCNLEGLKTIAQYFL